jgi:antitoxin (DNA-binding transcriptional repressor) of toxin-antitoxin stability system
MSVELSVTEVARHFSEYLDRVQMRGESFVLVRGKRPIAELRPLPTGRRLGELPAILASLPRLSPQEAEEWGVELDAARSELGEQPLEDPWVS